MSMHFERTVFLGEQCIEKRSHTNRGMDHGYNKYQKKTIEDMHSDYYCFASAAGGDRGSEIYLAS